MKAVVCEDSRFRLFVPLVSPKVLPLGKSSNYFWLFPRLFVPLQQFINK